MYVANYNLRNKDKFERKLGGKHGKKWRDEKEGEMR